MYLLTVIPYLAILAAFFIAFWPRAIASGEMARQPGGYNNSDPRSQQQALQGTGRRAIAAHQNGMEALPFFGMGVLAAMQRAVDPGVVTLLSLAFLVCRFVYVLAYLRDASTLRSSLYSLGMLICIALYVCAAFGWPKW